MENSRDALSPGPLARADERAGAGGRGPYFLIHLFVFFEFVYSLLESTSPGRYPMFVSLESSCGMPSKS